MKKPYCTLFLSILIPANLQSASGSSIETTYLFRPAAGEEQLHLAVTREPKKISFQMMYDNIPVYSKLTLDNNTLLLEDAQECPGINSLLIHGIPEQATLLSLLYSGRYPRHVIQKEGKYDIVLNKHPMRYLFYAPIGAKGMQRLIKQTQGMSSLAVVFDYLQRKNFLFSVAVIDLEAILHAFHGQNWKDELPWRSAPYTENSIVKLDSCKRSEIKGKHIRDIHGFLEKLRQDQKRKVCIIQ